MADLADLDWLITTHGDQLHHATLTRELHTECEEWGGLYDVPLTLDCGIKVTTVHIPAVIARLACQRCTRCCRKNGLPAGKGSPKNSDECRRILGMPACGGAS